MPRRWTWRMCLSIAVTKLSASSGGNGKKSLGRRLEVGRFWGAVTLTEGSGSGVEASNRVVGWFGHSIATSPFLSLGVGMGGWRGLQITSLGGALELKILAGGRGVGFGTSVLRGLLLPEGFGGFLDQRGCSSPRRPTTGTATVVADLVGIRDGLGHLVGR